MARVEAPLCVGARSREIAKRSHSLSGKSKKDNIRKDREKRHGCWSQTTQRLASCRAPTSSRSMNSMRDGGRLVSNRADFHSDLLTAQKGGWYFQTFIKAGPQLIAAVRAIAKWAAYGWKLWSTANPRRPTPGLFLVPLLV